MVPPDDDPLQLLTQRVVQAVASAGCRGTTWIVYDAMRVYVENDDGVLGYLTVHRDATISAEGMRTHGAELLAHVQRELGDGNHA
jgi:hypothetical protein